MPAQALISISVLEQERCQLKHTVPEPACVLGKAVELGEVKESVKTPGRWRFSLHSYLAY